MGRRGPVPMPTSIRMLRGNKGKRPVNPREPQPERKAPTCPEHLDAEAKKEWKRLSKLLLKLGVLTEADGMALACLCQTWSTLGKAQRKLNETGLLFKTPSGYVQQSPFVSIVSACGDIVMKLSQEFGLTPAARGRLQIGPIAPENTEKSKWDIFFENRK
jgi:P27 family predicted phage terminase small subunit